MSNEQRRCDIDAYLVTAARSPAFARFCQRAYGMYLGQLGTTDMEQLEVLLDMLALAEGERVVDLGCGLGLVSEYVSDRTGAHVTGIDCAPGGIQEAIARTKEKAHRIVFQVGNMDALDLPAQQFDAVIAIDVLYFAADLIATMSALKRALKPGGRMGIYHTQMVAPGSGADLLKAERTPVASALEANGLAYRWRDLTDNDVRFWRRLKSIAEEMKAEFEAEGNGMLCTGRIAESTAVLDLAAAGNLRRYLYHATM